jgi:UDP-GlcNAc:undecaprenyl-phosphate GlcNAc-1-phosphate transferase
VFLGALLACGVLLPLALPLYVRLGLVDKPNARSAHSRATPRGVGLVIVAGFWIALLAASLVAGDDSASLLREGPHVWAILSASTLLVVAGFVDDVWRLPALAKLFLQCSCALVLFLADYVVPLPEVFGGAQYWVEGGFTFLWVVGVINAVNFIDGSDGYCTAVSLLCVLLYVALSFVVSDDVAASGEQITATIRLVGLATAGAALPFLIYNLSPARCFLGDTGSMFFGFVLALLGILMAQYARPEGGSVLAAGQYRYLIVPWLVLFVPVSDGVRVALLRLKSGRSPFRPDNTHMHHVLQSWGLSPGQMVITVSLLGTTFGVGAALLLIESPGPYWVLAAVGLAIATAVWFLRSSYRARRLATNIANRCLLLEAKVPRDYCKAASFKEQAEQELARARRRASPVSLAVVTVRGSDLELPGASPLENPRFLQGLLEVVRMEDLKGRFGVEFLAFLLVETDKGTANDVIARIRERFARVCRGESQHLRFGIGLVSFPRDGDTFSKLFKSAEEDALVRLRSSADQNHLTVAPVEVAAGVPADS